MMLAQSKDDVPRDLVPWFHPAIVIGTSAIDGEGVIARESIPVGDVVMRMGGYLLPAASRGSERIMRSTAIGLSEGIMLAELANSRKDISDSLNHGCCPNLGFLDAVTVVAVTDILPGVEITIDYGYWECDEGWVLKQPCRCGSAHCRRVVRGSDWRRADVADRFLKWASPFIRRRIRNDFGRQP